MSNMATIETFPLRLELRLTLTDAEVIHDLCTFPEGTDRDAHATTAMKIGILALKQANAVIDGDTVRKEGERLLADLRDTLQSSAAHSLDETARVLAQYFDPNTGQLTQRIERLIAGDGDLNRLLERHLSVEGSTIAKTLTAQVGNESPLFRLLSPDEQDGVVASLAGTVESVVQEQRAAIMREFSLDNHDSALRKLVAELSDSNGKLKRDLAENVRNVTSEFSLDNENGALTRLVKRVESANKTIADQLSFDNDESAISRLCRRLDETDNEIRSNLTLDDEQSSLFRLRRELLLIIERVEKANSDFQTSLSAQVASLVTRRDKAARSTQHGNEYEEALGQVLQSICASSGDVYEDTRSKVGRLERCKVGDHVIAFSADSATPEVSIAFEAKDRAGLSAKDALEEIERARANRGAQFGVFVFSPEAVPAGVDTFSRFGSDLIIVWDRENVSTDLLVRAAISVCRALAVKEAAAAGEIDVDQLEKTVNSMTKQVSKLGEIVKWAATVRNNGDKISDAAASIKENLEERMTDLEDHLDAVRQLVGKQE